MVALVIAVGCTRKGTAPDVQAHSSSPTRDDEDGDGFAVAADCDDQDADVHFGAHELVGDGVDSDCDGMDGSGTPLSSFPRFPPSDGGGEISRRLGHAVSVGDLAGDAASELVVGSYDLTLDEYGDGGIWILQGASLQQLGFARGEVSEGSAVLGQNLAIVDVIGGPQPDLIAHSLNDLHLSLDSFPTSFQDLIPLGLHFPATFFATGDLTGDGLVDFAWDNYYDSSATVEVWAGPVLVDRDAPDIVLAAPELIAGLGSSAIQAGDWNADGIADLFVAVANLENQRGRVFALPGPIVPGGSLADAFWVMGGERQGDWFGAALGPVADLNGDGQSEVLVSALGWPSSERGEGARHGRVYALRPGLGPEAADYTIESDAGHAEMLGKSFAVGDFDADGTPDLAVGAPGVAQRDEDWLPGRVLVYFGPILGSLRSSDADLVLMGEEPGAGAGWALASADITGDGTDDLVVGCPFVDSGSADAGSVYLIPGPLR